MESVVKMDYSTIPFHIAILDYTLSLTKRVYSSTLNPEDATSLIGKQVVMLDSCYRKFATTPSSESSAENLSSNSIDENRSLYPRSIDFRSIDAISPPKYQMRVIHPHFHSQYHTARAVLTNPAQDR